MGIDRYEEEALWKYLYERHDDYHNAFDGDRFIRWVLSFFLPAWHAKCPGTPPILVLDICPSHIVGMPNKTVCTDATRAVVRSIGRRKWDVVMKRNGVEYVFPLTKRGEEFARAPVGSSLDELRQEMLRLYKAHRPDCLNIWVELELEKEGGEAILTPTSLCVFQPNEHY